MRREDTGRKGEDMACKYLSDRGHTILERNWRAGHLETDIISMDRNGIHFVEVKTRRLPMQGNPEDSVTTSKQRRLVRAAQRFLSSPEAGRFGEMEVSFDVVSVTIDTCGRTCIDYLENAFLPLF